MTGPRLVAAALAFALAAALVAPAAAQSFDEAMPPVANSEAPEPAPAATPRAAPRYFIEFRSRAALSYGHAFVVFGRVGERLTAKNVAGLHPQGNSPIVYMLGHILLVPSETGASDGDLEEQYLTARYRLALTPAQYRAVVAHIRDLQASSPVWNAVTYNCNAFIGSIAHFVGLISPPTSLLPEDFINSMRRMNDERSYAVLPGSGRDAFAWTPRAPQERRAAPPRR